MRFRDNVKPNWCPGCGDYAGTSCFAASGGETGTGTTPTCCRLWHWLRRSAFRVCLCVWYAHNSPAKALPFAQGLKLANPELNVIACGGDGDGMAIGPDLRISCTIRRNVNLTYILMDNHVVTKGRTFTAIGTLKAKTTPTGNIRRLLRLWKWPYLRGQVLSHKVFLPSCRNLPT